MTNRQTRLAMTRLFCTDTAPLDTGNREPTQKVISKF